MADPIPTAHWYIPQGDWLSRYFDILAPGGDLTGIGVYADLRRYYGGKEAAELEVTSELLSSEHLRAVVQLPETETAALDVGEYVTDFVVVRESPKFGPFTVARVVLHILPRATKL